MIFPFQRSGCTMDRPQCKEAHRDGNAFLLILLQVSFYSDVWSSPGQWVIWEQMWIKTSKQDGQSKRKKFKANSITGSVGYLP